MEAASTTFQIERNYVQNIGYESEMLKFVCNTVVSKDPRESSAAPKPNA